MHSAASEQETSSWLVSDGAKELELLLQAVLSYQSEPILIANDERCCLDASSGATKFLGLPMRKHHRPADPTILWSQTSFPTRTKSGVLPGRNVLALNDNSSEKNAAADSKDYAFFSLDAEGRIAAWHSGAERIYGYKSEEIIGQYASCLYLDDDELGVDFQGQLKKTAAEGHSAKEGWHKKKDGSRFWANALTTACRDQNA